MSEATANASAAHDEAVHDQVARDEAVGNELAGAEAVRDEAVNRGIVFSVFTMVGNETPKRYGEILNMETLRF